MRSVPLPPRRPLPPEVREHLARVRHFVFPGQIVQRTTCPVGGCGERSAPTWPPGDLRRCAPLFEPLCPRHREIAQVDQLVRGANERTALAVAMRSGPLLPFARPAMTAAAHAQRVVARAHRSRPVKPGADRAKPTPTARTSQRPHRCALCLGTGHNRRTCPRAEGGAR